MSAAIESSHTKKQRSVNSVRRHAHREQQQQLIKLLIQILADRDAQITRLTALCNFMLKEVITDVQTKTVGAWVRRQQPEHKKLIKLFGDEATIETIRQNLRNHGLIKD